MKPHLLWHWDLPGCQIDSDLFWHLMKASVPEFSRLCGTYATAFLMQTIRYYASRVSQQEWLSKRHVSRSCMPHASRCQLHIVLLFITHMMHAWCSTGLMFWCRLPSPLAHLNLPWCLAQQLWSAQKWLNCTTNLVDIQQFKLDVIEPSFYGKGRYSPCARALMDAASVGIYR